MKRNRPLLALAVLIGTTGPLAGQTAPGPITPRFQEVIRLAQEGYGDSARAVIARLLQQIPATDSSYPEALFTSATVARTGEAMRTGFARVAVEFSASPWADKALLRLAQLEYGSGNLDAVIARVTRLFTDYPRSPMIPSAAIWGSRAAFEQKKTPIACDWITRGLALVGNDVETRNQLEFARKRCDVGPGVEMAPPHADSLRDTTPAPPARTDTTRPGTSKPVTRAPVTRPAPAGKWRVQVAAITDKAAIARVVKGIRNAGFTAFQVAGPRGLVKIQAGPFATRDAAQAELARFRKLFGGNPFPVEIR